jgi:hypothetical protein
MTGFFSTSAARLPTGTVSYRDPNYSNTAENGDEQRQIVTATWRMLSYAARSSASHKAKEQ